MTFLVIQLKFFKIISTDIDKKDNFGWGQLELLFVDINYNYLDCYGW